VVGIRGPGRIPHILQLPGSFRLRGRIVAEVLRGFVLFRRHRAGQPEPGPVLGVGVYHVLRASAQGGRARRHRAHASVHPGHGPGRGAWRVSPAARLPLLLGRRDSRVQLVHMAIRGRRARGRPAGHLVKRPRPDHRVRAGHVSVPRAGPWLRSRQPASRGGRELGGPTVIGFPVTGSPLGPVGRHLRRFRPTSWTPQRGLHPGPAAQVAVQHDSPYDGRVPHQ